MVVGGSGGAGGGADAGRGSAANPSAELESGGDGDGCGSGGDGGGQVLLCQLDFVDHCRTDGSVPSKDNLVDFTRHNAVTSYRLVSRRTLLDHRYPLSRPLFQSD
ncbi:hypothetical protein M0802_000115 [Mischocyttarus mexicanus]|nr:hypothetical protein M0802_000115 [Mischocyttarus mexicanus]